jgi:hypothetical protein
MSSSRSTPAVTGTSEAQRSRHKVSGIQGIERLLDPLAYRAR